jgi:CBS domain-containing protein
MPFTRAGQLARATPTVRLDDPIGLVAANLRESPCGAVVVLDRLVVDDSPGAGQGRVLGIIDDGDLARAVLPVLEQQETGRIAALDLVAAGSGVSGSSERAVSHAESTGAGNGSMPGAPYLNGHAHEAPVALPSGAAGQEALNLRDLTARVVMRADTGIVPSVISLHNTLLTLDRYNSAALPVVDEAGGYRGMISRADVVAALDGQIRPPVIGGMATPLGVWLTTGHLSAGAPPLGLFLSGMVLAFCFIVAHVVMLLGLAVFSKEWALMYFSGRVGATSELGGSFNLLVTVVEALLFLLTLRALPMAGIHAAEHQTVWAIERGVPLVPEYVAQMPRAHPRCGTNLVAIGGLIQIIFQHLPSLDPTWVLLALLFVYLTWRNFGRVLQERFTTKPATRKQLESGIRAGEELLKKYQEQPHVTVSFGARLFNSGLVLSVVGMALMLFAFDFVQYYLARLVLGF